MPARTSKSVHPATPSGSRSQTPNRKVTSHPSKSVASRSGAAPKATEPAKKVSPLELMVKFAPKAKSAVHLLELAGLEDTVDARRSIEHHSQGRRALSAYRSVLVRADDPSRYIEKRPPRKSDPVPDLSAALSASVKAAKATRSAKPKPEPKLSRAAKTQAP